MNVPWVASLQIVCSVPKYQIFSKQRSEKPQTVSLNHSESTSPDFRARNSIDSF
jgi:hypothetical protein